MDTLPDFSSIVRDSVLKRQQLEALNAASEDELKARGEKIAADRDAGLQQMQGFGRSPLAVGALALGGIGDSLLAASGHSPTGAAQHAVENRRQQVNDAIMGRIKGQQEQFNNDRSLAQNANQFAHQNLQGDIALGQLGETQRRNNVEESRAIESARKTHDAEARLNGPADEAQRALLTSRGGLKPDVATKMTYGEADKLLGPLMSNQTRALSIQLGSDPANMDLKRERLIGQQAKTFADSLDPIKNPLLQKYSGQTERVAKGLEIASQVDANGNLPREKLGALKSDFAAVIGGGNTTTAAQLHEIESHTSADQYARIKSFLTNSPEAVGNKEYVKMYSEALTALGKSSEKAIKAAQLKEMARGYGLRKLDRGRHDAIISNYGLNPDYINEKGVYVEPPEVKAPAVPAQTAGAPAALPISHALSPDKAARLEELRKNAAARGLK